VRYKSTLTLTFTGPDSGYAISGGSLSSQHIVSRSKKRK